MKLISSFLSKNDVRCVVINDIENYAQLKTQIIEKFDCRFKKKPKTNLDDHFEYLRSEFIGRSELEFFHAKLVVCIRRHLDLDRDLKIYFDLWTKEVDYLCDRLSLRWLISAADTFADHAPDGKSQVLGLAASLLVNTIKLVETERMIQDTVQASDSSKVTSKISDSEMEIPLFDGLTVFRVGRGDMIRNLRDRLLHVSQGDPAGQILREVFARIQAYDTVYHRFRNRHIRKNTMW